MHVSMLSGQCSQASSRYLPAAAADQALQLLAHTADKPKYMGQLNGCLVAMCGCHHECMHHQVCASFIH